MQKKEEERRIVEDQAAKDRYWKIPICYDNDEDYTIAITPILSTKEPVDSLIMEDEHLDTILATESDKVIKSSVEDLIPIPSEFEGIPDDTCDVPVCDDSSTFDALSNHSEILSDSNDDDTSKEKEEIDLEDILRIQDVILQDKLLNINRLITNIESLKDNLTLDHVLESPSSFPILVTDSDTFFEEFDTSLSHLDNSLPEFETFSDHTKETRSGSTTNHVINSLLEYDLFLFEIELDQGGICLDFEPDAPVINNFDELNEDEYFNPGGGEIDFSQNVEDDDSFTFIIRTFLLYFTYAADSPLLFSTGSEDTIFDPGIST
ncbi:hypothetical protein Tco_0478149 [Tanacetum coccineum]